MNEHSGHSSGHVKDVSVLDSGEWQGFHWYKYKFGTSLYKFGTSDKLDPFLKAICAGDSHRSFLMTEDLVSLQRISDSLTLLRVRAISNKCSECLACCWCISIRVHSPPETSFVLLVSVFLKLSSLPGKFPGPNPTGLNRNSWFSSGERLHPGSGVGVFICSTSSQVFLFFFLSPQVPSPNFHIYEWRVGGKVTPKPKQLLWHIWGFFFQSAFRHLQR